MKQTVNIVLKKALFEPTTQFEEVSNKNFADSLAKFCKFFQSFYSNMQNFTVENEILYCKIISKILSNFIQFHNFALAVFENSQQKFGLFWNLLIPVS